MWGANMLSHNGESFSTDQPCTQNDRKSIHLQNEGSFSNDSSFGGVFFDENRSAFFLTLPGGKKLPLIPPVVMGIINATPDSFFAESRKQQVKGVVQLAKEMVKEGASILDIGGESSRPGAKGISIEEELDRVIPAIEAISKEIDVVLSVDTRKSRVAEAAIKAGAQIINDISAMQFDSRMIDFICLNQLPIVVMHMQGEPETMQDNPEYQDIVSEINQFFYKKIQLLLNKGLQRGKIILDPGIGFGKTVRNNLQIINHLESFHSLGYPLMIGSSRKSFIGSILGYSNPQDRLTGTLATTVLGVMKGVHIFRVHDVQENFDAIHMAYSIGKETCDDAGFVKGGGKNESKGSQRSLKGS